MAQGAEKIQSKYLHLNEASGPVFKIRNDPRYTKIGKRLSRYGLDELPQLINIIKGDMSFVGPRPFPVEEANKIPKKYDKRFSVLPGITSSWVVSGGHKMTFDKWMELDLYDISHKSYVYNFTIILKTVLLLLRKS